MGDENKKKTEDDSVTVMGLPGHPEKVGKSMSRRGEDIARKAKEDQEDQGQVDLGERGASGRPAGGSTMKSMTGVDPQDPITETGDAESGDRSGANRPHTEKPDAEKGKGDKKLRKA